MVKCCKKCFGSEKEKNIFWTREIRKLKSSFFILSPFLPMPGVKYISNMVYLNSTVAHNVQGPSESLLTLSSQVQIWQQIF